MRLAPAFSAVLIAAFAMTLTPHALTAQQQTNTSGVIRGTVADLASKQPIEGAKVSVVGTPFGATTKADGTFYILATMGTYTVLASAPGYSSIEVPNMTVNESGGSARGGGKVIELTRAATGGSRLTYSGTLPLVEQGRVGPPQAATPLPVRTFALQTLSADAAALLLSPYVPQYPGGASGVFQAGATISAITVRAPKEVLATVDSILHVYDHAPMTITLHFKLIVATDSAVRDNAIADIDPTLRQMFRFGGYRQLAEGSTTISERSAYSMTLTSGGTNYDLSGTAGATSGAGTNLSQQLSVRLYGSTLPDGAALQGGQRGSAGRTIVSTGLTVPIGQTVVIGGATGNDAGRTLILTLRPEVTIKR